MARFNIIVIAACLAFLVGCSKKEGESVEKKPAEPAETNQSSTGTAIPSTAAAKPDKPEPHSPDVSPKKGETPEDALRAIIKLVEEGKYRELYESRSIECFERPNFDYEEDVKEMRENPEFILKFFTASLDKSEISVTNSNAVVEINWSEMDYQKYPHLKELKKFNMKRYSDGRWHIQTEFY